MFFCQKAGRNVELARKLAQQVNDTIRSKDEIAGVSVVPAQLQQWPEGTTTQVGGRTYKYGILENDFIINSNDSRARVAAELKKLLDPVVASAGSQFQISKVDNNLPNYISLVVCPK